MHFILITIPWFMDLLIKLLFGTCTLSSRYASTLLFICFSFLSLYFLFYVSSFLFLCFDVNMSKVHTFIGHGNMVKGICRNDDTIVTASWLQTKVFFFFLLPIEYLLFFFYQQNRYGIYERRCARRSCTQESRGIVVLQTTILLSLLTAGILLIRYFISFHFIYLFEMQGGTRVGLEGSQGVAVIEQKRECPSLGGSEASYCQERQMHWYLFSH